MIAMIQNHVYLQKKCILKETIQDLAIVCEDQDGAWHRLIHKKTGCVDYDE